jgi:hypothetical protein
MSTCSFVHATHDDSIGWSTDAAVSSRHVFCVSKHLMPSLPSSFGVHTFSHVTKHLALEYKTNLELHIKSLIVMNVIFLFFGSLGQPKTQNELISDPEPPIAYQLHYKLS